MRVWGENLFRSCLALSVPDLHHILPEQGNGAGWSADSGLAVYRDVAKAVHKAWGLKACRFRVRRSGSHVILLFCNEDTGVFLLFVYNGSGWQILRWCTGGAFAGSLRRASESWALQTNSSTVSTSNKQNCWALPPTKAYLTPSIRHLAITHKHGEKPGEVVKLDMGSSIILGFPGLARSSDVLSQYNTHNRSHMMQYLCVYTFTHPRIDYQLTQY